MFLESNAFARVVDTPGRTSPILPRMPFQHLPRPVHPLDTDVTWTNPLG
jgi:hypothetical protein